MDLRPYTQQEAENAPMHRTRANTVVVSRTRLVTTIRRSDLIAETLAEVAIQGFDFKAAMDHFEGDQSAESLADSVRERLIAAAAALADIELERLEVWASHDWRDTCEFIADSLNRGLAVSGSDLKAVLP